MSIIKQKAIGTQPEFWLSCCDDDVLTGWLKNDNLWEQHLLLTFQSLIQPNHTVLDIGAHWGEHTVTLSRLAKKVVAFEAHPKTISHLTETVKINNCSNVECHNIGLWSHETELDFVFDNEKSLTSGFRFSYKPDSEKFKVAKLDDLVSFPVDVVKMDVEGCEIQALRGGQKIFETKPLLFVEINYNACVNMGQNTLNMVYQILSFGYRYMYVYDGVINKWVEKELSDLKQMLKIDASLDAIFTPNIKLIGNAILKK